jgi:hypothetical protein
MMFSKRRYFKFFLSVAMATRVLLGIKFFEKFEYPRNIPVKFG